LKDVNCDIEKGEVISIIGPSGTGKSTFLRALNLLDPPTGGEILFDGENILRKGYPVNRLRQRMGMVFQSFNLFDHLTILQNVTLAPIKLLGKSREDAEAEAIQLLRKVGMAEKATVYPSSLSGGQKQRVAIARALAMHPEAILFDEPTSALDPTMVGEVLSVIRQLAKEGMTMLIVTHEMNFARDVSTRIFFMYDGYIHEDGSPEQIFERPVHSATKAFVNRIRKLVFEVNSEDFDFLQMPTAISQFCFKYNIAEKAGQASTLIQEVLFQHFPTLRPITVRLTHTELSGVTALDFMVEKLNESPLQPAARENLRQKVHDIIEEPTKRGFRIKLLL
jgi:ABC-type polar amino acid transport system ATPase subunit